MLKSKILIISIISLMLIPSSVLGSTKTKGFKNGKPSNFKECVVKNKKPKTEKTIEDKVRDAQRLNHYREMLNDKVEEGKISNQEADEKYESYKESLK